ncbi:MULTISPECIES: PepSY domain-containing protein [unclassified Acidovorax]|uniref:PepSY-associated TM helix domain-containing protein n=1 Tax=unclassified Acidovorax TaxID=2684926 RepID=UPI001C437CB2|nr:MULTISPECIES: PepSY-associated TM helix domain-containing protein [unclassified Acidovorax]MBV7428020.1 PepSY domain-containing protein [Acidovorax sp. sif0732]MBV7449277.1 PepSY domain-containing protein [Acidovorax sp. sif0715]
MTSQRTLNRLFVLHSWAGIVTGLLMFIVCFSGAVVVFKNEIDLWANPSLAQLPRSATPASLDAVLTQLHTRYPGATVETIALPDAVNPSYFAFVRERGAPASTRTKVALRSDTGTVVGPVDSQLGQYLRMLHVFLFFGPRWIVGFLGAAMLVLIVTGIVIHRKILAELFTQRWGRSFRVVMSDLHKSAGIWGLGFHILIATTGAWMGLAPLFEQGYKYVTTSSTEAAATAKPARKAAGDAAEPVRMQSLDALYATAQQAVPGLEARYVSMRRWGTDTAEASFTGNLGGHLASTARVDIHAATGVPRKVHDPRTAGFWSLVNGLMEPLHFGDFGGLTLKWLYFFLGMTPAFLSISGTLIWLDARQQRRREAEAAQGASASGIAAAG